MIEMLTHSLSSIQSKSKLGELFIFIRSYDLHRRLGSILINTPLLTMLAY